MKMIANWLAVISIIIFVIDWSIVGLKLLDGDYDITLGAYIGLITWIVMLISILYIRFNNRCPNCGKLIQVNGKYCPHCGKELK